MHEWVGHGLSVYLSETLCGLTGCLALWNEMSGMGRDRTWFFLEGEGEGEMMYWNVRWIWVFKSFSIFVWCAVKMHWLSVFQRVEVENLFYVFLSWSFRWRVESCWVRELIIGCRDSLWWVIDWCWVRLTCSCGFREWSCSSLANDSATLHNELKSYHQWYTPVVHRASSCGPRSSLLISTALDTSTTHQNDSIFIYPQG